MCAEKLLACANPLCTAVNLTETHVYGNKFVQGSLGTNSCQVLKGAVLEKRSVSAKSVKKGITYKVYCNTCDQLFQDIDNPAHDVRDTPTMYLHMLRALAYQYQYTRYSLAAAHQLALGGAIVFALDRKNGMMLEDVNQVVNLDSLINTYRRYLYQSQFLRRLDAMVREEVFGGVHATRVLSSQYPLCASGVINPTHDLKGSVVELEDSAGLVYVVLPVSGYKELVLHVLTLDQQYIPLVTQISRVHDDKLRTFTNHVLSRSGVPLAMVLHEEFKLVAYDMQKLEKLKNLSRGDYRTAYRGTPVSFIKPLYDQ